MDVGRNLRWRKRRDRYGFSLIELAIIMVVAGILLVPLLRMAGSAMISTRLKKTQSILETASGALIAFAAAHSGCLPFAADFEGGQPDTDASGAASSTPDTGDRGSDVNAGDLPWADLGLTNSFLDGDGLRIQYYVATPYTDRDGNQPVIDCKAGFKGFEWDTTVTYDAPQNEDMWIYADNTTTGDRTLYKIKKNKSLDAGTHPDNGGADVTAYGDQLPATLLQLRTGPDVMSATDGQDTVISQQNVFILIAPGPNRNTDINRLFTRDATHVTSTGAVWSLGINNVDDYIFSTEPNVDASDEVNSGDDTMFYMSFTQFKAEMGKHGLNMESVCDTTC